MKKIFLDILTILKFKKKEKSYKRIFFCENKFILNYIKQYIDKKDSCLISYEKLNLNKDNHYYFENNFFLEFFFYILKIKYFYTSTPNIGENICRKSLFKKIKYIYLQHSPVGLINAYNKNAFINFDAINVINKHQISDVLNINKYFKKRIKYFKSKPNYLKNIYIQTDKKYNLLIAPTWNTNFYENHFLYNLIEILNEHKINYCFRPHPMSIKKNEFDLKIFKEKKINFDNSTNLNLFPFDNLITDWSGIMFEFFYLKQKKPILIDTNEKKINKLNIINNYESIENLLRKEIGIIHNKNDLPSIIQAIKDPINYKTDVNKYEIFF
jgi:YidC/Oxa1 family membrane protein insertase